MPTRQNMALLAALSILRPTGCQFFVPEGPSFEDRVARPCHLPPGNTSFCVAPDRCPMLGALFGNLRRPVPADVSLIISDSFFCSKNKPEDDLQVCCPYDGIVEPAPEKRPTIRTRDKCSIQTGDPASCVVYNRCGPLLQLLTNLQRPFPPELPRIMRSGFLCGFDQGLPQVCCPDQAVESTQEATPEPLTDAERFERHPNRNAIAGLEECGHVEVLTRIVNGENAFLGQFPWLANLGYQAGDQPGISFKCGGALIGKRYVLTAAHCVTSLPGSYRLARVRLGEHDLSKEKDCDENLKCSDPVQDFDIDPADVFFHQDYNKPTVFQNDIALIRLPRDAAYSDFVGPICLPFTDDKAELYLDDSVEEGMNSANTEVAGWGATEERGTNPADILQFLNVSVFDGNICEKVYAARGGIINLDSQLCAGGEKGKDSCVGDSGSALMREVREPPTNSADRPDPDDFFRPFTKLIGVVSFGPKLCGTEGVPGVYSKVRHYMDWILDNVST